jgi:CRISPR/Cas system CSM-associated protein Csm3 (group 7 of RAMP superfamily)
MTLINPYNFVPLKAQEPKRTKGYPGRLRFHELCFTGVLECTLTALSPIVTLDQRDYSLWKLRDRDGSLLRNRKGREYKEIKVFRFLRDSLGNPILQGTSLKGMIRSIYETITDSCLALAATLGDSIKSRDSIIYYEYADLGSFRRSECLEIQRLCPACRLFGTIGGDDLHCQGRVVFNDAILVKPGLVESRCYLKELSNPKPHHFATYAGGKHKAQGAPIRGRKFYYHQGPGAKFHVEEHESNDRSIAIDEYADVGSEFCFRVYVENLDKEELGKLLLAIELYEGLGHKVGAGKALGLGSCSVSVDKTKSRISTPNAWYGDWSVKDAPHWYTLKANEGEIPDSLVELLRLNKPEDGSIEYPPGKHYPSVPIDALGVFGGNAVAGKRPEGPVQRASTPLQVQPPATSAEEEAAWLKEIHEDTLIFVALDGRELRRPKRGYQGSAKLLRVGEWFVLSGTICVKPVTY